MSERKSGDRGQRGNGQAVSASEERRASGVKQCSLVSSVETHSGGESTKENGERGATMSSHLLDKWWCGMKPTARDLFWTSPLLRDGLA